MKIESSTVSMTSQNSYKESTKSEESLRVWGAGRNTITTVKSLDTLDLSEQAKSLQLNTTPITTTSSEDTPSLSSKQEQQLTLLQQMIEALTGKKIRFVMPKTIPRHNSNMNLAIRNAYSTKNALQNANTQVLTSDPNASSTIQNIPDTPLALTAVSGNSLQSSSGLGFEYNRSVTHYESQSTAFKTQASVKTADGREINIDLQLNLSREFMSQSDLHIQASPKPVMIDPLVINFGTATASVTDKKYSFDIDANGTMDQISFVGPGSGFLALDLNNDGTINDGSELFGPQSGNGFADLATYDSDGNNWIDENDAIYDKLQIWSKDSTGKDVLMALGQKGIGAIYLGNVDTSFALKGENNQTNGQLQQTGIYLNENGSAGTIQHIDLTI